MVFAGCFFHFAQANWRKVQDIGLKKIYSQEMQIRTLIKSCVSLALIPPADVFMGFNQVCLASESFPEIKTYLQYFEETWLGSPDRLGKRSKLLFPISLWNHFENAVNGNQKTNNVEGWHTAFQLGMGRSPDDSKILAVSAKGAELHWKPHCKNTSSGNFGATPPACSANSQ